MKKLLFLFLAPLLLSTMVLGVRFRGYLFYDSSCIDCIGYEEQFMSLNSENSIKLRMQEVSEGSNVLERQVERCGYGGEDIVLPVLVIEDKCVFGKEEIDNFINTAKETGDVLGAIDDIPRKAEPTLAPVITGVPVEEAKRNTLIFIAIMTAGMIGLVALGYKLGGKKVREMSIIIAVSLLFPFTMLVKSQAFCPVCTVAVGAGLGFAEYLGIDDLIAGIWIGGLLLSTSLWMIDWLKKKKWNFKYHKLVVYLLMYGLVIIPFASSGIIGDPYSKFWGIDKILLGIILGTLGFLAGIILSNVLLKRNKGSVLFPFQKVVFPITVLILLTLIFYFLVY
jgi:hypothetical protein